MTPEDLTAACTSALGLPWKCAPCTIAGMETTLDEAGLRVFRRAPQVSIGGGTIYVLDQTSLEFSRPWFWASVQHDGGTIASGRAETVAGAIQLLLEDIDLMHEKTLGRLGCLDTARAYAMIAGRREAPRALCGACEGAGCDRCGGEGVRAREEPGRPAPTLRAGMEDLFRGCLDLDELILCESPPEGDPVTLHKATISGDALKVSLSHGGGFEDHEYALCWDGRFPAQVELVLVHNSNGDGAEAILHEDVSVGLGLLRRQYRALYGGTEPIEITLSIRGLPGVVRYTL